MKRLALHFWLPALALLSTALLPASAQSVAELLTVTAIGATLDHASISLPAGSSLVKNPQYAAQLAPQLLGSDAAKYTGFQLYVARGLATRLADNYIGDLKTGFAASGYLESGERTVQVGADSWTRADFDNDAGKTMLLFVSKKATGVYFLTAQQK